MRILYHHRTRATDAQRVHILEIISAFRAIGHEVRECSLVPAESTPDDPQRDASEASWKRLARKIPFAYDLIQIAYTFAALPMILRAIRSYKPDFLYERYGLFNFAGVLAARIARVPLVLEVNSPFALEQDRDGDIQMFKLAAWSERKICNMAAGVVVVSTPLKRVLEAAGVRADRIAVMTNGVNLAHFQPSADGGKLRTALGLNGRVVIGFVGWFRNWHGLDMLLEAFHLSRLAEDGAALMLVGDGPETPNLRRYVQENGLERDVIFTGPLPHHAIPAHADLFDIAVQPAANEYCCPMKLLEYMALSKAIVAPRQDNIAEILEENREALFFTPRSREGLGIALKRLVLDAAERASVGARARAAIGERGYLWSRNAERVVEMVRRVKR